MSATAAVARGRAAAVALMVDQCTITTISGQVTDPVTGVVAETRLTVYSGRCRVQQADRSGDRREVGQVEPIVLALQVQVPVAGTETVRRGDLVTVTAARHDTGLVGVQCRVKDLMHKTHATSRRLMCEQVT